MKIQFSIILPIYNVERYLRQCINSVLVQDYSDYELILIDDGSPDRCPEICDEYKQKDARVQVIHKANGGLSDARNAGMYIAHGEYLLFLDGDDYWISSSCLRWVADAVTDSHPDVILHPHIKYYEKKRKWTYPRISINANRICRQPVGEALYHLVETGLITSSAWSKVIKRSMANESQLYFQSGLLSEDVEWTGRLMLSAKSYGVVNTAFYAYRQKRQNSITSSISEKHVNDLFASINTHGEAGKRLPDGKLKNAFLGFYAYQYSILLGLFHMLGSRERKDYSKLLRKMLYLLNYDANRKVKKVRIFNRLFGYTITVWMLHIIIKIKKWR